MSLFCITRYVTWRKNVSVCEAHDKPTGAALALKMRPIASPSASTSKSSSHPSEGTASRGEFEYQPASSRMIQFPRKCGLIGFFECGEYELSHISDHRSSPAREARTSASI